MIPAQLVTKIEGVRKSFLEAIHLLEVRKSFRALVRGSAPLRTEFAASKRVAAQHRLQQPCDPQLVCVFMGSEAALREAFTSLARSTNLPAEELAPLIFVDTPALRAGGSPADEVPKNILEIKPLRTCLQLLKNDDVDLLINVVEDGQPTAPAEILKSLEPPLGGGLPRDLENRLLVVPGDQGAAFVIRQLVDLVRRLGPNLFRRKYLDRTGLRQAITDLAALVGRSYQRDGRRNGDAVRAAVQACLHFLDASDLETIDHFARTHVDPLLKGKLTLAGNAADAPEGRWVRDAFHSMCRILYDAIVRQAKLPTGVADTFSRYLTERVRVWTSQWGYASASLAPPSPQNPVAAALVRHGLKLHCREILYQLLVGDLGSDGAADGRQDPEDPQQIQRILALLEQAEQASR